MFESGFREEWSWVMVWDVVHQMSGAVDSEWNMGLIS